MSSRRKGARAPRSRSQPRPGSECKEQYNATIDTDREVDGEIDVLTIKDVIPNMGNFPVLDSTNLQSTQPLTGTRLRPSIFEGAVPPATRLVVNKSKLGPLLSCLTIHSTVAHLSLTFNCSRKDIHRGYEKA